MLRYWEELQEQFVGLKRVKVDWHSVQSVLDVQERQFVITEAQDVQVDGRVKYYVEAQEVHDVPLLPSLQRVQKLAFVH